MAARSDRICELAILVVVPRRLRVAHLFHHLVGTNDAQEFHDGAQSAIARPGTSARSACFVTTDTPEPQPRLSGRNETACCSGVIWLLVMSSTEPAAVAAMLLMKDRRASGVPRGRVERLISGAGNAPT